MRKGAARESRPLSFGARREPVLVGQVQARSGIIPPARVRAQADAAMPVALRTHDQPRPECADPALQKLISEPAAAYLTVGG